MLLAPPKSNLAAIGDYVGLPKDRNHGRATRSRRWSVFARSSPKRSTHMRLGTPRLLRGTRSRFSIFLRSLEFPGSRPTLGSAGVAMFKLLFANKAEWREFLGQDPETGGNGQDAPSLTTALLWSFAASAYHGGFNSIYDVGYSPLGREVLDVDLCRRVHHGARRDGMAGLGQHAADDVARRPCGYR